MGDSSGLASLLSSVADTVAVSIVGSWPVVSVEFSVQAVTTKPANAMPAVKRSLCIIGALETEGFADRPNELCQYKQKWGSDNSLDH